MQARILAGAGTIALAALAAAAPTSSTTVERVYATRVYPVLQHVITPISNTVPFAWLDLLVLGALIVVVAILVRAARDVRRTRRARPALAAVGRIAIGAAAVYLVFLLLWGLNYRRLPMRDRLDLRVDAARSDAVRALGRDAVMHVNRLYQPAHEIGWETEEWRNAALRGTFETTQRLLSDAPAAIPGRLKRSVFGLYFRWAGIDGMVNPFALEVLANPDLLPFERPFVAAHEWSHLAGYAHEAEANFVGWLTCVRGDAAAQYSGWLYLYWQIAGELPQKDATDVGALLDPGPRRDVAAIVDRLQRGQLPLLRTASWTMYDQYLRANRVDEGVRSYGEVVNLILRARFDDGWKPVRRQASAAASR